MRRGPTLTLTTGHGPRDGAYKSKPFLERARNSSENLSSMKTISLLVCVTAIATASIVYLRNPALDKAQVHTERIGGSFAYKTSELLVYSPIVCSYNLPCPLLTISYQHPLSVLLAQAGSGSGSGSAVGVDVPEESQPVPEAFDTAVQDDKDDTITIEAEAGPNPSPNK